MKKLIVKYQSQLFPVLDALINGANLFIHIYISWFITQTEYGRLNAVFSFITVVMVTGVSIQFYVAKQVSDPHFNEKDIYSLFNYCRKSMIKVMFLMILLYPFIKSLLRVDHLTMVFVFGIFISNAMVSIYRGIYQGEQAFLKLSRSFYIEILIKVSLITILLNIVPDKKMALLGVWIGMTVAWMIDAVLLKSKLKEKTSKTFNHFNKVFFANFYYYFLTSISLIICNYYLQESSGIFAVSMRYSQVYIHVGFSIITVLVPIINKYKYDEALFRKYTTRFLLLCIGAGLFALSFYKFLFPSTIPYLFGEEYKVAGNYILLQASGYFLFVISSYFVSMEILIQKKNYTKFLLAASVVLTIGLLFFHQSIQTIIMVEVITFLGLTIAMAIDFYKKEDIMKNRKMHLLFLSWRDIKAPKKGGAEVFTHEMLKLVDKSKYKITHISPKFKGCEADEVIDGVLYKRRGNIATVILYAMYFYFKNRMNIDFVIDQCNEHRFFTPFWLPRHKRIFFIHQMGRELWMRNLKFPFSHIGYYSEDIITKIYRKGYTFTVSPSTKQDLLDLGFKDSLIGILPEGINFKPWEEEAFHQKEAAPTFTYVGRFAKYKGIDSAVEAFGKLKEAYPESKMWIVGKKNQGFIDSVLTPIIQAYHLKLDEDIKFFGFVSEEKKLELMSKSHSLLYPSDREGWGLTVTEAGAVGTPSIVYNSPGLIDAVNRGQAGIITDENTKTGLFEAMKHTLDNNSFYDDMRRKAYEFSKNFQWETTAKVLEQEMNMLSEEAVK